MCGISGIVRGGVWPMVNALKHRGPDHLAVKPIPPHDTEFGHNRLSILDLTDAGNQPMENSRYVLVYNGEIYNYRDLKPALLRDDDMAIGDHLGNDAAVLLAYLTKFGFDKTLEDINGMYAFAVYDKEDGIIHLVTDRMGQKPLYYTYTNPGQFAFASTPAALLHLREKWDINKDAVSSYWKLGSTMSDCIWEEIYKLGAAKHLKYSLKYKSAITYTYWTPQYIVNAEKMVEELVVDSIRKVNIADVPIHIFLSGGIDSTLVASQFRNGQAIHLSSPELKYAQLAAEKFGIELKVIKPRECEPISAMQDYVTKSGEPTMAGLTPWIVAREVAKFGKVAISANGADELFFGYDRTSDNITTLQLGHIFRSCVVGGEVFEPDINSRLSRGRWLELMTYVQYDLNATLDRASMAHSVEVRSPFLDHRLVECALSIPQRLMGRKTILKNTLDRMGFSNGFLNRPKMGFSLYEPIPNLVDLQARAYNWAIQESWLKLKSEPTVRDYQYLSAAAFGFKTWMEVWKEKINFA